MARLHLGVILPGANGQTGGRGEQGKQNKASKPCQAWMSALVGGMPPAAPPLTESHYPRGMPPAGHEEPSCFPYK